MDLRPNVPLAIHAREGTIICEVLLRNRRVVLPTWRLANVLCISRLRSRSAIEEEIAAACGISLRLSRDLCNELLESEVLVQEECLKKSDSKLTQEADVSSAISQ
jgi:hypothetical protein